MDKKKPLSYSDSDLLKWVTEALQKGEEALDKAPKRFEVGEGVQDVDPNDDAMLPLPEDKSDESK